MYGREKPFADGTKGLTLGDIKAGEPFGLDPDQIAKIDWQLALKRVTHDLRSDFIYSPHLSFIYRRAGGQVISAIKKDLAAGAYSPGVPLTIEVPKSFRIRVAVQSKRLGPNFSRPGSILLPYDRLFYQALADQAAPVIKTKTNKDRSFSHELGATNSPSMFLPTRTCWQKLQAALAKHAKAKDNKYILKVDIADFFGSVNQHTLINVLNDSGYPKGLSSRLEALLVSYTGERSSRGILQGMFPSDLLGNFYMAPMDRFLDDRGTLSARYVDDLYMFVTTVDDADHLLRELIPELRAYDLVVNEAKSVLMPKSALLSEEPDLETLFAAAVEEISSQVDDDDFDADYGFQSEWEDEPVDEEELELKATTILFDSTSEYPGQEENIERFCLPLFAKSGSDYAVDSVIASFKKRPAMGQIYASYLAKFLEDKKVRGFLLNLVVDGTVTDWQKMWVLAALLQDDKADDADVKAALSVLKDANRHDALRAVSAIYVGRFGDHTRRKTLNSVYSSVSEYIQAAIYYSSGMWPGVERSNAKAQWGSHSSLNKLITSAFANKGKL